MQKPHVYLKEIFILLAYHYIYDFQYHYRLADFFLFFEDKLLCIDSPAKKKSFLFERCIKHGILYEMTFLFLISYIVNDF